MDIVWEPPEEGWVKVNTDGTMKFDPVRAGYGGLLRNSLGGWLSGFSHNLGSCTTLETEMWGALGGLQLAWDKEYRHN